MTDNSQVTIAWLDDVWGMRADPQAADPSVRRATFWLLAGFCLLSALLGRLVYVVKPFDHDARIFIYMGKLVCDGGRFYHDIIDNKFPSVGLMTSAWWRVLGTWWPGYVIGQTLLAISGALLLARMAGRYFGPHARMPAALFALVYLNFNVAVFGGFQLETLQTFFAILAAGAALQAMRHGSLLDAFTVGLAGACAAMLKPTGLAIVAAFAVATCVAHWTNWRKITAHWLAALAGVAIPAAMVLTYLIRTDILKDMPQLFGQISKYAAQTPWRATDYCKPFIVLALVGFPVAVRAWVFRRDALPPTAVSESPSHDQRRLAAGAVLAVLWLGLELVGAVMQRRMYAYHFLPVAAPAALVYAMWPRRERASALAAALLPLMLFSFAGTAQIFAFYWHTPMRSPVSDYLAARTAPSDAIWADSMPRILLETGLKPGARIPLTFLFLNYDDAPLEYSAIMLGDFQTRRPKYIVLPMDLTDKLRDETTRAPELFDRPVRKANYVTAWRSIEAYVKQNYVFEKWVDGQMIYRRRPDTSVATVEP